MGREYVAILGYLADGDRPITLYLGRDGLTTDIRSARRFPSRERGWECLCNCFASEWATGDGELDQVPLADCHPAIVRYW